MKKLRLKLVCLLVFFTTIKFFGQTGDVKVIPPTPLASSLGGFGSIATTSYSGAANFSIPLYTVKGKNLEVPITLNYSSNGIPVEEIAPSTGLGWTLNGGGIIIRTILGDADEKRNFNELPNINNLDLTQNACQKLESTNYDLQYDEFTFNFSGSTGKFIIVNQIAKIIEAVDDFKIEIICSDSVTSSSTNINEIIITDKNGIRYFFGKSYNSGNHPQGSAVINNFGTPKTSWHLTKIMHWSGETMELEYVYEEQNQYDKDFGETIFYQETDPISGCESCPTNSQIPPEYTYYSNSYRPRVYHLSKIRSTNSAFFDYIEFTRNGNSMILLTKNNKIKLQLTSYTPSTRKFLTKVEFYSLGDVLENKYKFKYDHENFTIERNTKSRDLWGFFNGQNNNTSDKGYLRGNHNSFPNYAVYGMLTEIINPTGGKTTFEYEGNCDEDIPTSNSYFYGGVRLKKITYAGNTLAHDEFATTFKYNNSGEFYTPNRVSYEYTSQNCGSSGNCKRQVNNSNGYLNSYGTYEGFVFYSKITEIKSNNDGNKIEIVHYYNNAPLKTLGGPIVYAPITNVNPWHFYGKAYEYKTEFFENTIQTPSVRRLTKTINLEYENNFSFNGSNYYSYIREDRKNYVPLVSSSTPQNGQYYTYNQVFQIGLRFNLAKYQVTRFWKQLKQKRIENFFYDQNNNQSIIVEKFDYLYTENQIVGQFQMPIHHQIVTEIKTNSSDSNNNAIKLIMNYKYPDDLTNFSYGGQLETYQFNALQALKRINQHRIGNAVQIEEIKEKVLIDSNNIESVINSKRIGTTRTTYKFFDNNNVLPEIVKYAKGDIDANNPFENKVTYLKYTSTLKVLEMNKFGGEKICYLYDHDRRNIIAVIENANLQQLAIALGINENDLENFSSIGSSSAPNSAIENLRNSLPGTMITTYTYNSNDQITSIIDPKASKTSYQYDIFQRLVSIRDNNGNVIKENEYYFRPNN
jgi:YD repeat-containing protein